MCLFNFSFRLPQGHLDCQLFYDQQCVFVLHCLANTPIIIPTISINTIAPGATGSSPIYFKAIKASLFCTSLFHVCAVTVG